MPFFQFPYRVRLADTDAAGVVYFANLLQIAHTAYEQALIEGGINLQQWFTQTNIALPITHGEIDCWHPIFWGDLLFINLIGEILSETKFEITYHFTGENASETVLAKGITQHICINRQTRQRNQLPQVILEILGNNDEIQ